MSTIEFGIGSIGLAALITAIGGRPEEVDGTVEILSAEYPNPQDYESLIRQASGALNRHRTRSGTVDEAATVEA